MFFVVFVVFGVLLATASAIPKPADLTLKELIAAEKKCLANYPPELKVYLNELKASHKLPEELSEDMKCYLDCIGTEIGVLDEQGNYHEERLKQITKQFIASTVTEEEIHRVVEECIKVDHELRCEKAHLYVQCQHGKLKLSELHEDIKKSTLD